jgi:hypothetical protein
MATRKKAFIGLALSFIVIIVLIASKGGYRGARASQLDSSHTVEKICESETQ